MINVSCSRTQRSEVGEDRTRRKSSTLPLSHCAPLHSDSVSERILEKVTMIEKSVDDNKSII